MTMSEAQIDKDIADGRPTRSFFKPRFRWLLYRILWDRHLHDRFSPRAMFWIQGHWPVGTEMWDY